MEEPLPGEDAVDKRADLECNVCKDERQRRNCIISTSDVNTARYKEDPFQNAPFVNPLRYPTAHAEHLRALEFARMNKSRVMWTTAYDDIMTESVRVRLGDRMEETKQT